MTNILCCCWNMPCKQAWGCNHHVYSSSDIKSAIWGLVEVLKHWIFERKNAVVTRDNEVWRAKYLAIGRSVCCTLCQGRMHQAFWHNASRRSDPAGDLDILSFNNSQGFYSESCSLSVFLTELQGAWGATVMHLFASWYLLDLFVHRQQKQHVFCGS